MYTQRSLRKTLLQASLSFPVVLLTGQDRLAKQRCCEPMQHQNVITWRRSHRRCAALSRSVRVDCRVMSAILGARLGSSRLRTLGTPGFTSLDVAWFRLPLMSCTTPP